MYDRARAISGDIYHARQVVLSGTVPGRLYPSLRDYRGPPSNPAEGEAELAPDNALATPARYCSGCIGAVVRRAGLLNGIFFVGSRINGESL